MASTNGRRRLIVNADDFGASHSINEAVVDAHQHGILTTASLMVNGAAFDEAVRLARENPRLGVGLHLTLCCGKSALARERIPMLVNLYGEFRNSPVLAGILYFFSPAARRQLELEIAAQFDKFAATELPLDHLNGHLHFHLHPAVFGGLRREMPKRKVRAMRLTNDPLSVDWPLGTGRFLYRLGHAVIFKILARQAQPFLERAKIAHTGFVFGLLEDARVTEEYILKLLPRLPEGDSELYSHPSLDTFKPEYEALISPRVVQAVREQNVELVRYQDVCPN